MVRLLHICIQRLLSLSQLIVAGTWPTDSAASQAVAVGAALLSLTIGCSADIRRCIEWLKLLCRAVRQTAEAENNITSVERILDYTTLASEPPRVAEGASPVSVEHLAGPDHAAKPRLRL